MAEAYLTFRVAGQTYALPATEVAEIFTLPGIARLPLCPAALLGMVNLRGTAVPVASLRALLGHAAAPAGRAILLDGVAPVALAIDSIEALSTPGQIEPSPDEPGEVLRGAFQVASGAAKILDIQAMLARAFSARPASARKAVMARTQVAAVEAAQTLALLSFTIAGQDYALPLSALREIIPGVESHGIMQHRGRLLPVLSLRVLLGFPAQTPDWRSKILVAMVAGLAVGLAVDRVREVLHAEPAQIEPAPKLLAARAGGESRISAIYRGDKRLVSILAPEKLFAEVVMNKLGIAAAPAAPATGSTAPAARYLVFRLGDEEYGLPIASVSEVAAIPASLTRLPKTPDFLEGVVNLRGEVLPVIDQRRRFGLSEFTGNARRRRLIVLRGAGMIVDAVSEVLGAPAEAISPAPALAGETTSLVEAVLNLEGRLILLLNPEDLLTGTEKKILEEAAF